MLNTVWNSHVIHVPDEVTGTWERVGTVGVRVGRVCICCGLVVSSKAHLQNYMSELKTGDEGVTTNPEPTNFLPVDICSGRGRLIGGSRLGNFDGNLSSEVLVAQILHPVTLFFTGGRSREEREKLHEEPTASSSARGAQEAAHAAIAMANSFFQGARSARSCTRSHSDASPLPGKGRHVRVGFARSQQLLPVLRVVHFLWLRKEPTASSCASRCALPLEH
ncbi:hypothetical protein NDU88_003312 [Pleurodeles waltl]|uniref:Uncharacterized protein n=1 Tax=Pleurodeles waltl TaxID=8319 RepID=A0AAV7LF04_PLEWA|nr:hypothetical protein NDU88_003312 [Pleurodeles waltl]